MLFDLASMAFLLGVRASITQKHPKQAWRRLDGERARRMDFLKMSADVGLGAAIRLYEETILRAERCEMPGSVSGQCFYAGCALLIGMASARILRRAIQSRRGKVEV
jgi:hypothetical protein